MCVCVYLQPTCICVCVCTYVHDTPYLVILKLEKAPKSYLILISLVFIKNVKSKTSEILHAVGDKATFSIKIC